MPVDPGRAAAAISEFLIAVGEDPGREELRATPQRVAAAALELFAGVGHDAAAPLTVGGELAGDGPVAVRRIPFRSLCAHHLLPFTGTVSVVYLPTTRIAGFGGLAAAVEIAAARAQVQERLTDEIADAVDRGLAPNGVMVLIEAVHTCLTARGHRAVGTSAVTLAARGEYRNGPGRAEALALVGASA